MPHPQADPRPCFRQGPEAQLSAVTLYIKEQFSGMLLFSFASLL